MKLTAKSIHTYNPGLLIVSVICQQEIWFEWIFQVPITNWLTGMLKLETYYVWYINWPFKKIYVN